jgi:hypothetical protein
VLNIVGIFSFRLCGCGYWIARISLSNTSDGIGAKLRRSTLLLGVHGRHPAIIEGEASRQVGESKLYQSLVAFKEDPIAPHLHYPRSRDDPP